MIARPPLLTPSLLALFALTALRPAIAYADDPVVPADALRVLSVKCFACHGPDQSQRKADLRLDRESDVRAVRDSGMAIVPGDPASSLMIQRIESGDPDTVMPPPDAPHPLTDAEKQLLRRWVEQGAVFTGHWSFQPLLRPQPPAELYSHQAIDHFVKLQQASRGLTLSPRASPHRLARRLFLDAIGLPPTPAEADAFAAAPNRDLAWEQLIDTVLARPEFGEHWARMWMDLARYADTKGYEKDLGRTVWPWRDWLIRSLNADTPLDQLTREMLAGDLLPDATPDQRLATAFHRQTMSNDEGGTDDEEFRIVAVKDRVDTTLQVWMGLTAGCAKCHSHKYDPISQQEYYALFAIWNQTQDADRYDDSPTLEVAASDSDQQQLQAAREAVQKLQTSLAVAEESELAADPRWLAPAVLEAAAEEGARLQARPDGSILATGKSPAENVYTLKLQLPRGRWTAIRLQAFADTAVGGPGVGRNPADPNFVLSEIELALETPAARRSLGLHQPKADFEQSGWPVTAALDGNLKTGWAISPRQRENHAAIFTLTEPLETLEPAVLVVTLRQHYGNSLTLRRFRLSLTSEPPEELTPPPVSPEVRELTEQLTEAVRQRDALQAKLPKVPVMIALVPQQQRETRLHRRGNFLDPGESVTAALPAAFVSSTTQQTVVPGISPAPPTRLDAANWLMAPDNPLTARVWANRIWARVFGIGIVETEEDFGLLGSPPSNPRLLDWLACEYRDGGWSLKQFLKQIFLSEVYQQDSGSTPQLLEQDPRTVWLTRGPRYRLSAEVLRDQTLAAAGLLSLKQGGPPVMPPQPDGLWRSTYNGQKWINAEGEDRFRRALYTYLKRTTPYPSFTTFDGGSGEVCQIRRIRTNTPLQALVSLNDPVNLEAAGALALKMQAAGPGGVEQGLRQALIRPVTVSELQPLLQLQRDVTEMLAASPERATALLQAARLQPPPDVSAAELGGFVVTASAILNLDEFLTRN
ncbi:MAG: PSD1 and planctomycete cytochrome C domain-containing protein [Planctomycetota bacterium]